MTSIIALFQSVVAALSPTAKRRRSEWVVMQDDTLINRAIDDANARLDLLIVDLARQYPDLDRYGIFAGILAQHALYRLAADSGTERARQVAEDGVLAFEYDQPENHA